MRPETFLVEIQGMRCRVSKHIEQEFQEWVHVIACLQMFGVVVPHLEHRGRECIEEEFPCEKITTNGGGKLGQRLVGELIQRRGVQKQREELVRKPGI